MRLLYTFGPVSLRGPVNAVCVHMENMTHTQDTTQRMRLRGFHVPSVWILIVERKCACCAYCETQRYTGANNTAHTLERAYR